MAANEALPFRTTPRATRRPHPHFQVLVALDGNHVTQALLDAVLACCTRLTSRVDILLVNSPKAPISMLKVLLLRLEHGGIDYRLASTDGVLADEVARYLRRFLGISTVLVASLAALQGEPGQTLRRLREEGYQFIGLLDDQRAGPAKAESKAGDKVKTTSEVFPPRLAKA